MLENMWARLHESSTHQGASMQPSPHIFLHICTKRLATILLLGCVIHCYSWGSLTLPGKIFIAYSCKSLIWCYVQKLIILVMFKNLLAPYHNESHLNLHFYNLSWAQTRRGGSMQYISYCNNVRPSIRYSSISVGRETVQAWLQMVYDGTGSISAILYRDQLKSFS